MQDGDLIILRSTVKIGTTKSLIEPILQESNKIFNLAFCPERTLEGAALTELAYLPQIIGGINIESCERSARFFRKVTSSVITVANTETAEMIKLVDNMQRDVKFAISNEIAEMCNSQKINASEVISAGKLGYPRTNLSLPGPVGGPCLEKDSYILAESFEGFDVQPNIALTARATNERMIITVGNYILDWLEKNIGNKASQITILGMAFKGVPETDDLRGSTSVELFRFLKNNSKGEIKIKLWDPVISKSDIRIDGFCLETSLVNALEGSGVVILANNHPALQECHPEIIRDGLHSPHLIYDLWNRFGKSINSTNNSQYVPWGNHSFQEDSLTQ
jgi:nucleotide sugar dehydrogenase